MTGDKAALFIPLKEEDMEPEVTAEITPPETQVDNPLEDDDPAEPTEPEVEDGIATDTEADIPVPTPPAPSDE